MLGCSQAFACIALCTIFSPWSNPTLEYLHLSSLSAPQLMNLAHTDWPQLDFWLCTRLPPQASRGRCSTAPNSSSSSRLYSDRTASCGDWPAMDLPTTFFATVGEPFLCRKLENSFAAWGNVKGHESGYKSILTVFTLCSRDVYPSSKMMRNDKASSKDSACLSQLLFPRQFCAAAGKCWVSFRSNSLRPRH